jgi:hypothetical protein
LSLTFDEFDAVGKLAGEIDFIANAQGGIGNIQGDFKIVSYNLMSADISTQPPDPLLALVFNPIKDGIANAEFNKHMATIQGGAHWTILGLTSKCLVTFDPKSQSLSGYAEGLAGVSGLIAVVRKNK